MTESQRRELTQNNSQLYFRGYMTKNLHLCEKIRLGMSNLCSANLDTRSTLIALQSIDECLGIEESIKTSSDQLAKEVLLKEFSGKILNTIEKIRDMGVIDAHESYLIEHIEEMTNYL